MSLFDPSLAIDARGSTEARQRREGQRRVNFWNSFACYSEVRPIPLSATASSTQSRPSAILRTRRATLTDRLADLSWNKQWLLVCRNISDCRNERTFVAAILPF